MGTGLEVVHSELVNDLQDPLKRQLHKVGYEAGSQMEMDGIVGMEAGDICYRKDLGSFFVFFTGVWVLFSGKLSNKTVVNGDSGIATYQQQSIGSMNKIIFYLSGFSSATGLTIFFPQPLSNPPFVTGDAGVIAIATITASHVVLTTSLPVTGYLILEGF